jgi:hypothetical protein
LIHESRESFSRALIRRDSSITSYPSSARRFFTGDLTCLRAKTACTSMWHRRFLPSGIMAAACLWAVVTTHGRRVGARSWQGRSRIVSTTTPHRTLAFASGSMRTRSHPGQSYRHGQSLAASPSLVGTPATSFDDGQRPFQITTPIYYVNDKPHIGHAYTSTGRFILVMDGAHAPRHIIPFNTTRAARFSCLAHSQKICFILTCSM